MSDHGGFEGNAQTLHILARVEKKQFKPDSFDTDSELLTVEEDRRRGLNFTYRSLASILKYDEVIPERHEDRMSVGVQKGYYNEYTSLVENIKRSVVGDHAYGEKFKTVECSIMDIADDIAYSTYDMEDCFKSGHLNPLRMLILNDSIYQKAATTINKRLKKQYADFVFDDHAMDPEMVKMRLIKLLREVFALTEFEEAMFKDDETSFDDIKRRLAFNAAETSYLTSDDGYYRTQITSALIQNFMESVEVVENDKFPQLHNARLDIETFKDVESLKNVVFESVIRSPEMQTIEYRGKSIVAAVFDALSEHKGNTLLPRDFRSLCEGLSGAKRRRVICDFVAGMTDRYAWEFYNRIAGTTPHSLFTPL